MPWRPAQPQEPATNPGQLRRDQPLGIRFDKIHDRFSAADGPASGNDGWYAMDVEFKFDNNEAPAELARLYLKQARPYPEP
jgi:hypothetical protein